MLLTTSAMGLALLLSTGARAQTSTSCNPTNTTCPSDTGLNQASYSVDFTKGASPDWVMTYNDAHYGSDGLTFTINKSGDAPTMQSNFYMFFGSISAMVRAAPGTGIVSCIILESDDLDEIDWEWLGGDVDHVQTNYFGKGNTTTYDRGMILNVPDSQKTLHNYTIAWGPDTTAWYIDGALTRTLNFADAVGGKNYPQTPMRIKLGTWIAADTKSAGTIAWAGGKPDYSQAPFNMVVERIDITNTHPAGSYSYGDLSGDWQSIKIDSKIPTDQRQNTTSSSSNSKLAEGDSSNLRSATGATSATSSAGPTPKSHASSSASTSATVPTATHSSSNDHSKSSDGGSDSGNGSAAGSGGDDSPSQGSSGPAPASPTEVTTVPGGSGSAATRMGPTVMAALAAIFGFAAFFL